MTRPKNGTPQKQGTFALAQSKYARLEQIANDERRSVRGLVSMWIDERIDADSSDQGPLPLTRAVKR